MWLLMEFLELVHFSNLTPCTSKGFGRRVVTISWPDKTIGVPHENPRWVFGNYILPTGAIDVRIRQGISFLTGKFAAFDANSFCIAGYNLSTKPLLLLWLGSCKILKRAKDAY